MKLTKMKKSYYYNPKKHILNKWGYPIVEGKKEPLHRWMAEQEILKDRKLLKGEVVHHVNGDKLNFNPKNLAVMSKRSHDKIEGRLRKERNLNKANLLIFFLILFVFLWRSQPITDSLGIVLFCLILLGTFVHAFSSYFDWFIRKTRLYKIIDCMCLQNLPCPLHLN